MLFKGQQYSVLALKGWDYFSSQLLGRWKENIALKEEKSSGAWRPPAAGGSSFVPLVIGFVGSETGFYYLSAG